jgi:ssDNA thymidine ADP-ribosyltransferase, DarT
VGGSQIVVGHDSSELERPIYHITHVENLASIITEGRLWSDAMRIAKKLPCKTVGMNHIKERRLRRQVPVAAKGTLGEYVPFNFCNRSIMLYALHRGHPDYDGGQDSILHLVSTIAAAVGCGRPFAFTDRHADLAYTAYFDSTEHLSKIPWKVMPVRQWGGDNELKAKRQAEFLVHKWFPWECVHAIVASNRRTAERAIAILEAAEHRPAVMVEPSWYY